MNSPRYAPAGLLVAHRAVRVMVDGGPGAEPPPGRLDAWLVTDAHGELMAAIRRLCRPWGLTPQVTPVSAAGLRIAARRVTHTSHPTFGYDIGTAAARVVWAPEFWRFPSWAAHANLMFAEAAGWDRPIRFANRVGGHMAVIDVAAQARSRKIGRLVFAHIGRPSIRARDAGLQPPFGEWGVEHGIYAPRPERS
jgi:hypothetical protein